MVVNLSNSFTAFPSALYSFFVFNLTPAETAMNCATPLMKKTLSDSVSISVGIPSNGKKGRRRRRKVEEKGREGGEVRYRVVV